MPPPKVKTHKNMDKEYIDIFSKLNFCNLMHFFVHICGSQVFGYSFFFTSANLLYDFHSFLCKTILFKLLCVIYYFLHWKVKSKIAIRYFQKNSTNHIFCLYSQTFVNFWLVECAKQQYQTWLDFWKCSTFSSFSS